MLARKYRPTSFDDLIGQEAMVRTLRNAFATGRVAHAFMLTGVRGVGKTTTARIIARALNCIGPDGTGGPTADPCGVCANCVAILADRHPDVVEMDAASRTGVDDVREIIEATPLPPDAGAHQGLHHRRSAHAVAQRVQRAAEDAGGTAAAREVRVRHDGDSAKCRSPCCRAASASTCAACGWRNWRRISAASPQPRSVAIEPAALDLIARAADGSVRDGLSLLDQAIAQADGAITDARSPTCWGWRIAQLVFDLLDAVMAGQTRQRAGRSPNARTSAAPISARCCRICWSWCTR